MNEGLVNAPTTTREPIGDESLWINRKASAKATKAARARQASGRRRFVDPATCEREYTAEETEFMQAMQAYKLRSGRPFPTLSEVLEVIRSLGYTRRHKDLAREAEPLAVVHAHGRGTRSTPDPAPAERPRRRQA